MGRQNPETKRFLVQFKKCIHCDQLILRKINKIGATRCQFLRLKCTKFDFRLGFSLDPAEGAYNSSPDPLALYLRGSTSKEREGKGGGERNVMGGKVRGGEGVRRALAWGPPKG